MKKHLTLALFAITCLVLTAESIDTDHSLPLYVLEPYIIRTEQSLAAPDSDVSVRPNLSQEDFAVWEPSDSADLLRYFPNVNVNKPAIGSDESLIAVRDQSALANGRLWILVDGFPISNPLRAGAQGAPRLNLVDPQTIDSVELQYGPFSAAYGGYALGSVIHYKTLPIDQRSGELGVRYFWHDFELYDTADIYEGYRANFRYSERFGGFGIALSGSYLDEEGNPQRFYSTTNFASGPPGSPPPTTVEGGTLDEDPQGNERIVYGSQGTLDTTVGTLAIDTAYYFDQATLRATSRYSDREVLVENSESYLTNAATGEPVTSGTVIQDGRRFRISSRLAGQESRTASEWLNGIGLSGELSNDWSYDLSFSALEILDRENESASRIETTPNAYWLNSKATFEKQELFNHEQLDGYFGYEWIGAKLEDLNLNGDGSFDRNTGGQTDLQALFAAVGWQLAPKWRAVFGLRAESWSASDGFAEYTVASPPPGPPTFIPATDRYSNRDETSLSPKFSLEYAFNAKNSLRFNVAQTERFPLIQELYRQEELTDGTLLLSNPDLQPEDNLSIELSWIHNLPKGRFRLTAFRNEIKDAILQQFVDPAPPAGPGAPPQPPSYSNVDLVESLGIEAFVLRRDLLIPKLEASAGAAWMRSEITEYRADPSVEGNEYPGIPQWRVNASLRYRWNKSFDTALGVRYQSHIFERIDNTDTNNTYQAVGERIIADFSAVYRMQNGLAINIRIDNLFDEEAFTNRPERQRTYSIGAEWSF